MAKQRIEIGLSFSADTSKAKGSLQQLEKQLNSFLNNSVTDLPLTKNISAAQEQAAKLSVALKQAVNIDTGKFDLSKFQSSLKKSNTDLKTLRDSFVKAGPEGTKTFMALAQSIVAAEVPTKRINAGLEKMLKTLKDTARWQISSNIMHGLQGALQDAYGYAQDLNKSLNDIRIVTGYSTDRMEDFAVSANKAAKALSTTTNEYTKASLIYFQQGLSDQEVTKRTQTTIKMANVTGEAAEDVSSYMTAVWNNFDDGSKKLEYYADAITALGAATASSSEEIATGLQKFSAVANTVGLSYEYATAALATVTSQTRESAETVGTAFKTIFARLESLSLGETLDDDTTMTKYSQALAQVGVNIKTANGDLKDMDTIIDELGGKWNSISKDQQIALAQTVAGMRQYNNFIALLDNYETMKLNVEIAADSEGTLDEQASIYAESWEAASDRVRAAAETIYEKILDDDFFIDLLNGFEKLLGLLDKFIDSAGGLQGILFGVSSILLKTFSGKAAEGLENMVYNFKEFFGLNKKKVIDYKEYVAELTKNLVAPSGYDTPDWNKEKQVLQKKLEIQLKIADIQESISATTLEELRTKQQINELTQDQTVELARQMEEAQKKVDSLGLELRRKAIPKKSNKNRLENLSQTKLENFSTAMQQAEKKYSAKGQEYRNLEEQKKIVNQLSKEYQVSADVLWEYYNALQKKSEIERKSKKATKAAKDSQEELNKAIKEAAQKKAAQQFSEGIVKLTQSISGLISASAMISSMFDTLSNPDTSGWEKFLSIFTTLTMVIPMLVSSIKAFTEIQWKSMGQTVKETIIKLANAAATKAQVEAEEELNNSKSGKGKKGKNTNRKKSSSSQTDNTKFTAETWKGLGKIAGKFGLIAAAVGLVVGAIALSVKLYNKADEAARKSEKQAKILRDQAAQAKEAYQEAVGGISKYKEGSKALSELTRGTIEWKEQLQETNAEASKLIEQFNLKRGEGYIVENGVITINQEALAAAREEAFNKQTRLDATASAAEAQALAKRNEALRIDLARQLDSKGEDWQHVDNSIGAGLTGAAAGALIGSAFPVIGTAIGAAVGGIAGVITGALGSSIPDKVSTDEESLALKKLQKAYEEDSSIFSSNQRLEEVLTEDLKLDDETLIRSLVDNRKETEKLISEMQKNTEQLRTANEKAVRSSLAGVKGVDENDIAYEAVIAAVSSGNYSGFEARKAEIQAIADAKDAGWNDDYWKWYIETMYGEGSYNKEAEGGYRVSHQGGFNATLEMWDTESNSWKSVQEGQRDFLNYDSSKEQAINKMLMTLGSIEGEEDSQIYKQVRNEMIAEAKKLTNIGLDYETAMTAVAEKKRNDNEWNLGNIAPGLLKDLQNNGFEDQKAVEEALSAWGEVLDNYSETSQGIVDEIVKSSNENLKKITKESLSNYMTALDSIYLHSGTEAQNTVGKMVNNLMTTYSSQSQEILNLFNSLPWETGQNALDSFIGGLYDLRIVLSDTQIEELQNSLDNMGASVLVKDLDKVRISLQDIQDIIKGTKFGDIISDEDYKKIIAKNASLKNSFIMTAEGMRYVGEQSLDTFMSGTSDKDINDLERQYAAARAGAAFATDKYTIDGQSIRWGSAAVDGREKDSYLYQAAYALLQNSDMLTALNIEEDTIKDYQKQLLSNDPEKVDQARAQLQKVFGEVSAVITNDANGAYNESYISELKASLITTTEELQQAYIDGALGTGERAQKLFEQQLKVIKNLNRELKQEVNNISLEYYDFLLKNLPNTISSTTDKIGIYTNQLGVYISDYELASQNLQDLIESKGAGNIENLMGMNLNLEDRKELETYIQALQNSINNIYSFHEQVAATIGEHFDFINKEYDKTIKAIETVVDLTEHYKNIVELTGRGMLNIETEFFQNLGEAALKGYKTQMTTSKQLLKGYIKDRQDYEQMLADSNLDDKAREFYQSELDNVNQLISETENNLREGWAGALEAVAEIWKLKTEELFNDFEKQISGGFDSLNDLSEAFNQQSTLNKQYLANYEKIYELTKLTRNIEKSINDTGSIKAKQNLRELESEITALQASGAEISEYDLGVLQKRFELRQAEIALEEAQSAKSTVRLTQDASGNWGYVYTQNSDQVDNATQNYEDKLFALQDYSAQYLEEMGNLTIEVEVQMLQALKEIENDLSLTEEAKKQKIKETIDFYMARLNYSTSEYSKAIDSNALLAAGDYSNFAYYTGLKIESDSQFATSFNDSILAMREGYNSAEEIYTNWAAQLGSPEDATGLLGGLKTANDKFTRTINEVFELSGTSIEDFAGYVQKQLFGEGGSAEEPSGGAVGDMDKAKDKLDEVIDTYWPAEENGNKSVFEAMADDIQVQWNKANPQLTAWREELEKIIGLYQSLPETKSDELKTTNESFEELYSKLNSEEALQKWLESQDYEVRGRTGEQLKKLAQKAVLKDGRFTEFSNFINGSENVDIKTNTNTISPLQKPLIESKGPQVLLPSELESGLTANGKSTIDLKIEDSPFDTVSENLLLNTSNGFVPLIKTEKEKFYINVDNLEVGKDFIPTEAYSVIPKEGKVFKTSFTVPEYYEQTYKGQKRGKLTGKDFTGLTTDLEIGENFQFQTKTLNHVDYYFINDKKGTHYFKVDDIEAAIKAYDTGGYTGQWGPEGRLAMLHQKEIVLNASDTANLLASVSLIRDITKQIDLQAAAAASGLGSLAIRNFTDNAQTLQQDVTIHAEFPNVTNHNEIEQAFDTLINRAAQYTNRSF